MKLEILNEQVNKNEILEKLESVFDFQDEYIDSNIQEIATRLSKEFGVEVDDFSDQVWLNSYIIFRKDDIDIFKISFDKYVKSFDEDEEPNECFKDTLLQLHATVSEQITIMINYEASGEILGDNKFTEKICEFLNNKVSLNNIGWLGFTERYNKDFPPELEALNRPRIMIYIKNNNDLTIEDFDLNGAIKFFNDIFKVNNIVFPDTITFLIEIENNNFNINLFVDNDIIKSLKKVKAFNKVHLGLLVK